MGGDRESVDYGPHINNDLKLTVLETKFKELNLNISAPQSLYVPHRTASRVIKDAESRLVENGVSLKTIKAAYKAEKCRLGREFQNKMKQSLIKHIERVQKKIEHIENTE